MLCGSLSGRHWPAQAVTTGAHVAHWVAKLAHVLLGTEIHGELDLPKGLALKGRKWRSARLVGWSHGPEQGLSELPLSFYSVRLQGW